jgi:hypothetical protein
MLECERLALEPRHGACSVDSVRNLSTIELGDGQLIHDLIGIDSRLVRGDGAEIAEPDLLAHVDPGRCVSQRKVNARFHRLIELVYSVRGEEDDARKVLEFLEECCRQR